MPGMQHRELAAWLRLLETPGLGPAGVRRLLAGLGGPEAVLAAGPAAWRAFIGPTQVQALSQPPAELERLIERSLAWLQADPGHDLLALGDADYPALLLQTADPPLLLYLHGRRELLAAESLAIVGSRSPTPQGRSNAEHFGRALGEAGLTVVSGLALGVDGAAHSGALATPASTIAVLGTGLDQIYPPRHQRLGEQIAALGLLLSEYPLGMPPLPGNFPRRNRIIAGLARGCLVVEATLQSGSLITARLAAEAGREVFAIPGSIHAPQSHGCHALIRQGAKLVERVEDVLEELPGLRGGPAHAGTAAAPEPATAGPQGEAGLVLTAMGFEPVSLDALQARGGWSTAQLNALLLELELAGEVARLPGQLFQRQCGA